MRMDPRLPEGAEELIKRMGPDELTSLFRQYGELQQAHKATRAIQQALKEADAPAISTDWLQTVLAPLAPYNKRNQYLAQAFQALRIAVNDEMGALEDLLKASLQLLDEDGRLVVISYHSLEDRLVKHFMRSGNFEDDVQKDMKGRVLAPFHPLVRKAIVAQDEEMDANPRARSARLRVAERTEWMP